MKNRGKKRVLTGTVVSNKMDKTATILVERMVKHSRYHKYIRRRAIFAAHDKDNACDIGDRVLILETKPISRTKRWRVCEIVKKAV